MENEWERDKQKILNSLLGSGPDSFQFQQDLEVMNDFSPYVLAILSFGTDFKYYLLSFSELPKCYIKFFRLIKG